MSDVLFGTNGQPIAQVHQPGLLGAQPIDRDTRPSNSPWPSGLGSGKIPLLIIGIFQISSMPKPVAAPCPEANPTKPRPPPRRMRWQPRSHAVRRCLRRGMCAASPILNLRPPQLRFPPFGLGYGWPSQSQLPPKAPTFRS